MDDADEPDFVPTTKAKAGVEGANEGEGTKRKADGDQDGKVEGEGDAKKAKA